jgi:hypothetical protein
MGHDVEGSSSMSERAGKRGYTTPSLVDYGSISKLTQGGASGEGGGGPIIDIMIMLPI